MTRQITNAPTEAEALDFVALVGHNGSTRNAKDVVTPGGAVCNTLAPTRKGQKLPDSTKSDTWYKRDAQAFLTGVQGMGPELIGAYAVILEILYARHGDMDRDDRHLAGVLGCSIRKARSLTEHLVALGKVRIDAGKVTNDKVSKVLFEREKQREKYTKQARNGDENRGRCSDFNNLTSTEKRREEYTPLSPQGGPRRKSGVPENVIRLLNGEAS